MRHEESIGAGDGIRTRDQELGKHGGHLETVGDAWLSGNRRPSPTVAKRHPASVSGHRGHLVDTRWVAQVHHPRIARTDWSASSFPDVTGR